MKKEMNRTQHFALNSIFAMLNNFLVMISGFIIPRLMLLAFGSSINGLVSSITQFISYFNLVEAGLASASIVALYKPLADNDSVAVNGIVSATKKYYYQAGYLFSTLVFILAVIFPIFTDTNTLSNLEVILLVIFIGANGFLNFFSLAKYRALLTASQKVYIVSIASIVYTLLHTVIIIIGVYCEFSILAIYFSSIFAMISRNIILHVYVKKNFTYVNFNSKPNFTALSNRWDALVLQFVGLAQTSAPTLILTILVDLKLVSVYTIYNMVISGVQGVLGIFTNSLASSFGDLIARKDKENLQKAYKQFELIYLLIISIVYVPTFNLMLPFITLYTSGVQDIDYILPMFSILMVLNSFFYIIKTPQGMLINSAGHFKETKVQATIQALIIIVGGLILVPKFKLLGIVLAMSFSNLYRFIDMFFYVQKYILFNKYSSSFKNYSIMFIIILLSQSIIFVLPSWKLNNYLSWSIYAGVLVILTLIVALLINLLFNKKDFNSVLKRFSTLRKV